MKIRPQNIKCFLRSSAALFLLIIIFGSCGGKSGSDAGNSSTPEKMTSTLFGVNLSWERLGDNIIQNGDLLRDSSFRYFEDGNLKTEDVWIEVINGGTAAVERIVSVSDPGYTPPSGSIVKAHTGYVRITQSDAGQYTGVLQQLKVTAEAGVEYTLKFSSFGVGSDEEVSVFLYDNHSPLIQVVSSGNCTAINGVWSPTPHEIKLTPATTAYYVGIYLHGAGEIKIDEVRLYKSDTEPSVKTAVKSKITDLGIKSLRWPGGTLADWFEWKDSIGPLASRGELATYNGYETPALGLHEFLDLCEELNVRPLIIVNIRAGASNAADLVEYILGPPTSAQGAIRAANGRTSPWNNSLYFEIGNEPPAESDYDYSYDGSALEDMGTDYADRATAIITAMKGKASLLNKTIFTGGISETAFQLPGWVSELSPTPVIRMIAKWNSQVFGSTLLPKIDFTHGHFYSSRYYHTTTPGVLGGTFLPAVHYNYLMTGGEVLKRTIAEKIKPLTGSLPVWITEYHVLIEEEHNPMPYFQYCMDYQSGLSIADMIMKMIESGVDNAYAWNLSQNGSFGLMGNTDDWYYRPAGLVFKMFSVIDGEEKLTVSHDNSDTVPITTGYGNAPSGLSYDVISALSTKNRITGKPRLFILNRGITEKTVTVSLDGYTPGNGKVYLYNYADLLKNNEDSPYNAVTIIESTEPFSNPLSVTIPAHSLKRIDFQ